MNIHSDTQKNPNSYGISKLRPKIPNLITSLRIVVLPHLIYSVNQGITPLIFSLFLFAISTDLIDGYIARKFKAQSKTGAYFDVTVDFIFMSGMYLLFIIKGFYSPWILVIISGIFIQFILTSIYSKRIVYDPIGKYYGSLLLVGIGLTLLFQTQIIYNIVAFGIISSTTISILSRILYFLPTNPKAR